MRTRILTAAAAVALGAVASFAPVAAQAASAAPASGVTFGEIQLVQNTNWCITEEEPNTPGSDLVLGKCAGATSQEFYADVAPSTGDYYFWLESKSGMCITVPNANGAPDGKQAELGTCTGDVSQTFEVGPQGQWELPFVVDAGGHNVVINDAGDVLKAYNPINSTYLCSTCNSEIWTGPPWYVDSPVQAARLGGDRGASPR